MPGKTVRGNTCESVRACEQSGWALMLKSFSVFRALDFWIWNCEVKWKKIELDREKREKYTHRTLQKWKSKNPKIRNCGITNEKRNNKWIFWWKYRTKTLSVLIAQPKSIGLYRDYFLLSVLRIVSFWSNKKLFIFLWCFPFVLKGKMFKFQ